MYAKVVCSLFQCSRLGTTRLPGKQNLFARVCISASSSTLDKSTSPECANKFIRKYLKCCVELYSSLVYTTLFQGVRVNALACVFASVGLCAVR